MGGFSSITGQQTIMNADNASFDGTERGGALNTNGQLWIGATTSPNVRRGSIVSPDGSITVGYSNPNINLRVTSPATPRFLGWPSASDVPNVTGDNNPVTVLCDHIEFDIGNGYDPLTGDYTAPEDGYYLVTGQISWQNLSDANSKSQVNLNSPSLTPQVEANPGACRGNSNNYTQAATMVIFLSQGDTCRLSGFVDGPSPTVGYIGDFFGQWTYLSIIKII